MKPTDVVVSGGSASLTVGSTTTILPTGDGTLATLVSAINAGSYGVKATTVQLPDGTQRVSLLASSTRSSSAARRSDRSEWVSAAMALAP